MAIIKKSLLSLVLCFGAISFLCAVTYPSPQGYVSDFAGVLDASAKINLESLIGDVEQRTSAQIAVMTVKNLEGDSIEHYANELFAQWGIGIKEKDNGLLILFALEDRRVWVETGYGLEPILPDGKVGQIIRETMIPQFKENKYGQGLLLGTAALAGVITGNSDAAAQKQPSLLSRIFGIIFFIILAIIFIRHPFLFLLLMMGGRRSGGFGGGGFSGRSGGFGGFGGGMSGGGGAGGRW